MDRTNPEREELESLIATGADLSELRTVQHAISFPDSPQARAARAVAHAAGFATRLEPVALDVWLLELLRVVQLDETYLVETARFSRELASRFGGHYDGWEAEGGFLDPPLIDERE